MNNVWLARSKTKKILHHIDTNGIHHLRNCSSFYLSHKQPKMPAHYSIGLKTWEAFYVGTIGILKGMGYTSQSECWIATDPDTADLISSTITVGNSNMSHQYNEFVGLINGIWWLYSCPLFLKTKTFGVTTALVGADIRPDGSAQMIGALEIS